MLASAGGNEAGSLVPWTAEGRPFRKWVLDDYQGIADSGTHMGTDVGQTFSSTAKEARRRIHDISAANSETGLSFLRQI